MKDFLFIDKMITPKIITVVYWLMLAGAVLWGLTILFQGFNYGQPLLVLGGLLAMVVGALFARIWCELLMVLFKMNEALQEIRNK